MPKRKKSNKKKKAKKPRNVNVIIAIIHCKGGSHKDKRNKRKKIDDLWKQELDNNK